MRGVKIIWHDAYSPDSDRWQPLEEAVEEITVPMTCTTIGFLIKETDQAYLIADTTGVFDSECYTMARGLIHIPKSFVVSVADL